MGVWAGCEGWGSGQAAGVSGMERPDPPVCPVWRGLILQWLAGTIKGMPRFHKTKMKANGREEEHGSVLKSFKELFTAGPI
jgi:hypothetical protein